MFIKLKFQISLQPLFVASSEDDDGPTSTSKGDGTASRSAEEGGGTANRSAEEGGGTANRSVEEDGGTASRSAEEGVEPDKRTNCIVCLTDPIELVILPCRHTCLCSGCCQKLLNCPICRKFIVNTFPI